MCRKNLPLALLLTGVAVGLLLGCLLGNGASLVFGVAALFLGILLVKKC